MTVKKKVSLPHAVHVLKNITKSSLFIYKIVHIWGSKVKVENKVWNKINTPSSRSEKHFTSCGPHHTPLQNKEIQNQIILLHYTVLYGQIEFDASYGNPQFMALFPNQY